MCKNNKRKTIIAWENKWIKTAMREKRDSVCMAKYNRQKNSLRSITDSNCQKIVEDNIQSYYLMNSNDLIMRIQKNTNTDF